MRLTPPELATS